MRILVCNAGSSSVKFGIFDMTASDARIFKGEFEGFKGDVATLHYQCGGECGTPYTRQEEVADIHAAIARIPALLAEFGYAQIDAVGHRVAHGGNHFTHATVIDEKVMAAIESCIPLAPLHNPANMYAINNARALWGDVPHIAVFDTAFHQNNPEYVTSYAVPKTWRDAGLRRYGFHGTSHKYVGMRVAESLGCAVTDLKIISCHLGNGASICAINHGFSLDSSMGMTPLEGLVMGTRSGDVDPGIFGFLQRELGLNIAEIEEALYTQSGLKALAGTHDVREIEALAAQGNAEAQLAITLYAYRTRKYIGAYAAAMGGVDVIAFTGGIGENSATMRRRICEKGAFLGISLDEDKNHAVQLRGMEVVALHSADARVKIMVTQASEQWMIAKEVQDVLSMHAQRAALAPVTIPVAVSARHVHLSQEAVEQLFGAGHQLTKMRSLSQPEGWAAEETVQVIGSKGTFERVRVLGPTRSHTQIEISKTDTFTLGIDAPVRQSGQLEHSPTVLLRGTVGEYVTDGLIIAARHIHMNPEDAVRLRVAHGEYVDVKLGKEGREVIFTNVMVRVKEGYALEMHIDTDEANAAGIASHSDGTLMINEATHHASIICKTTMVFAKT